MNKWIMFLFIAASLSSLTILLAPPSKCVEEYAVIGGFEGAEWDPDVIGEGLVGTKTWCSTSSEPIWLELSEVLDPNPDDAITVYPGKVRILTGGHPRFDFWFSEDGGSICGEDNPSNQCRYHLLVTWGISDTSSNTVLFADWPEPNAVVWDETTGDRFEANANFFVQLSPDGGGGVETGPENTQEQCTDEADNDGDGKIDCADPNCKKWCQ